jgi:hypothetical protein
LPIVRYGFLVLTHFLTRNTIPLATPAETTTIAVFCITLAVATKELAIASTSSNPCSHQKYRANDFGDDI